MEDVYTSLIAEVVKMEKVDRRYAKYLLMINGEES